MTPEKLNYIYNYVVDDIEYSESAAVEYAVNNLFKDKKIEACTSANTFSVNSLYIKVIEVDYEYHYYLITINKNGERNCIYINEKVSHYGDIRRDHIVLYLLMTFNLRNIFSYHIHEGYLVRAVKCKNGLIRLKQILSYGIDSLNKEAQHAIGNEEPIFSLYKCECGSSIFYIKDETVGMDCPFCSKHILF